MLTVIFLVFAGLLVFAGIFIARQAASDGKSRRPVPDESNPPVERAIGDD